jgi:hypothetical protein
MAATAAMPVAAQAQDPDRTEGRTERQAARAERAQEHYREMGERNQARYERRQEAQAPQVERQQVRQERVAPVQQQQQQSWARRGGNDGQRGQSWGASNDGQRGQSWGGSNDGQRGQSWSGGNDGQRSQRWSGGDRSGNRDSYRQQIEESREASRRSAEQTIGGNYARQADRNQQRYEERLREQRRDGNRGSWSRGDWNGRGDRWSDNRDGRRSNWDRSWRSDNRYDWQRYRYSNRNRFHLGSYYSPYRNYSYNRLSIGLFLDSLFYSNRYWLSDPWQYRLPPAPYGTQWVRYYDDVVLVDVYTGEVLDVIYDFFW